MPSKRRAKGEGSIVRHKSTGLWAFAVELPAGTNGKRRRRFIYAKTKPELMRKITDLRAAGGGTIAPRAAGTLSEWVESWLETVRLQQRLNTCLAYKNAWLLHAKPRLGHLKMGRFDPGDVRQLYSALSKDRVSQATIQKVGVAMRRAFNVAIREGRYRRANPFSLVGLPKHDPKGKARLKPCRGCRVPSSLSWNAIRGRLDHYAHGWDTDR